MPATFSSEDHLLQIFSAPNRETQIDVFHPTGCTESCPVLDHVLEHSGWVVAHFGVGTWRVELEGHPPCWAGTEPVDGDAWLQSVTGYER